MSLERPPAPMERLRRATTGVFLSLIAAVTPAGSGTESVSPLTKEPTAQSLALRSPEAITKKPVIVFIHGIGSKDIDEGWEVTAKQYERAGYRFIQLHLDTTETSSLSLDQYLADVVRQIRDIQRAEQIDPKQLIVFGTSFGGNMAAKAATAVGAETMVTDVPATYPEGTVTPTEPLTKYIFGPYYNVLKQERNDPKAHDAQLETAMHDFKGHMLCIAHGPLDTTTPPAGVLRACAHNEESSIAILKGAGHAIDQNSPLASVETNLIQRWLQDPHAPEFKKVTIVYGDGPQAAAL